MGTMTIDGRKVEFTAIIQSSLHLEHAVYVQ